MHAGQATTASINWVCTRVAQGSPLLTAVQCVSLQAKLEGIYESSTRAGLQQLALRYSLPDRLVKAVGAPPTLWTVIRSVPNLTVSTLQRVSSTCSSTSRSSLTAGSEDAVTPRMWHLTDGQEPWLWLGCGLAL